jgi:HAMP domain-containing protein/predicted Ser/Thr protein kinase
MATSTEGPGDPQATQAVPEAYSPVDLGATTPLPRAAASDPLPSPDRSMPPPPKIRGLGLGSKIFFAVAVTVGIVLAATLAVVQRQASAAAESSIHAGLLQTAKLIENLLNDESNTLSAKSRIYVESPGGIRTTIEQTGDTVPAPTPIKGKKASAATPVDSGNFGDAALTMSDEVGATWVQLTDRNGMRLARSDKPAAPVVDLSGSSLISAALDGKPSVGYGVADDSVLFHAVAVPIYGAAAGANARPVGVAMATRNIGDSSAVAIQKETGSDIVFFALDSIHHVRVVGTTPRLGDKARVDSVLTSLIMAASPGRPPKGPMNMGTRIGDMAMDNEMGSTKAQDNVIDGHTYVWTVKPLTAADNETVVGGVVSLRDREEALRPFTALRNGLLLTGGIALLVAFIIATAVSRQITQPVRGLVDATRRAAEGDYNTTIPTASGEIGALSDAFNTLLEDLREKQSLVDFLQSPTGGKTVAAQAARMSVERMQRIPGDVEQLQAGSTLANRYSVTKVLGAGGMGMVYKATDNELGETVAIKTLRPEIMQHDPAALDRFRSEIRLARKISHRNVVRTHDIGESNGLYYITMEFVEGSSLKDLIISRGRLPAPAVISIGKQLCRALEVAHEAGVIHRDIKPQNMVVEADGTVKVMDFGIARLQMRSEGHTQAGMVVGTPEYMSPEQLRGDDLDGRADIYSAGVVLYESLTGTLPHVADTPGTLIAKVLTEVPQAPRASVAEVSPALSAVIMQALSKDREQRPKTALEFLALLERA